MPRLYIVRSVLRELKEVAEELQIPYRRLLVYIVEEQYTALDNANAALARELDDIAPEELSSIRVGNRPFHIVRDISQALSLRRHSTTTYLVKENLVAMRNFPDTFPGLRDLRGASVRKPQVTLYSSVWNLLEKHLQEDLAEDGLGDPLPNAQYVRMIFDSLPTAEILGELKDVDLLDFIDEFSGGSHPVSVSYTTHTLVKNAAATMQVPMLAVSSFIVWNEIIRSKLDLGMDISFPYEEIFRRYRQALRTAVSQE